MKSRLDNLARGLADHGLIFSITSNGSTWLVMLTDNKDTKLHFQCGSFSGVIRRLEHIRARKERGASL